ncbi:MAG TPA: hypothetical protein VGQ37_23220 [Vicinamibacterales bacterium]|jgi:hypothetical protein|nr:hypothetical protein [Vicinamibacterales bacterium]
MGCDIHCYIEHREKADDGRWWSLGGRINPRQNYRLFERLAGARGDRASALVPPRGVPDDVGWEALHGNWRLIAYGAEPASDLVTPEEAAVYVEKHGSRYRGVVRLSKVTTFENGTAVVVDNAEYVGRPEYVSDPDFHSHSWLTPAEWERATADFPDEFEYSAMLAAMRDLERRDREVRVVFWFDN